MKRVSLFSHLLLTALAGDLLYLYHRGVWYDPIKAIEMSEVIILYIIGIMGLVLFFYKILRSMK